MSEAIGQQGFIHNRLVQMAGIGMSILTIAGCTSGHSSVSHEHSSTPVSTSTPSTGSEHSIEATPASIPAQYDDAYDFIVGFDNTDPNSPVSIPKAITDPKVRQITLKAAELKIAADIVNAGNTWPVPENVTKEMSFIPDVQREATTGLIKDTYANILLGFSNGSSDATPAKEKYLDMLLAQEPAQKGTIEASLVKYAALAQKTQAELGDSRETSQWSTDNNTLTDAWSKANDDATTYWSNLNDAATTAETAIFHNSPKYKAAVKQSDAEYQRYLHQCDNLVSPELDKCAADEAVSDAQGGYDSLYDKWVVYVHDPIQKDRIEAAAANQAISDIQGGYDSLAEIWSDKVSNATDRARIDQAFAVEAESSYDQGYDGLGDDEINQIHDPQLRAQAEAHKK